MHGTSVHVSNNIEFVTGSRIFISNILARLKDSLLSAIMMLIIPIAGGNETGITLP
jgi:hypothetical protein